MYVLIYIPHFLKIFSNDGYWYKALNLNGKIMTDLNWILGI